MTGSASAKTAASASVSVKTPGSVSAKKPTATKVKKTAGASAVTSSRVPRNSEKNDLLRGLQERLDLLTHTLSAADVAEKSLEIVKEIKELHNIICAVRSPASTATQRVVVVWGGPESKGSSAQGPGQMARACASGKGRAQAPQ